MFRGLEFVRVWDVWDLGILLGMGETVDGQNPALRNIP